jgi:hypothetical protein
LVTTLLPVVACANSPETAHPKSVGLSNN